MVTSKEHFSRPYMAESRVILVSEETQCAPVPLKAFCYPKPGSILLVEQNTLRVHCLAYDITPWRTTELQRRPALINMLQISHGRHEGGTEKKFPLRIISLLLMTDVCGNNSLVSVFSFNPQVGRNFCGKQKQKNITLWCSIA